MKPSEALEWKWDGYATSLGQEKALFLSFDLWIWLATTLTQDIWEKTKTIEDYILLWPCWAWNGGRVSEMKNDSPICEYDSLADDGVCDLCSLEDIFFSPTRTPNKYALPNMDCEINPDSPYYKINEIKDAGEVRQRAKKIAATALEEYLDTKECRESWPVSDEILVGRLVIKF